MLVIKRSGEEVLFDPAKIYNAIAKANASMEKPEDQLYVDTDSEYPVDEIQEVTNHVVARAYKLGRTVSVEEIQDMVEEELAKSGHFNLARKYITYRYNHAEVRRANTTDEKILSLIGRTNEEVKQENSNKNPTVNSTQRDYMAGEVSKDITKRFLLPEDIWNAHEKGIIHFHDADYFAQPMYNCCLVNLEDMLQNGTVISETGIDKPHSFATACNIATQIIAQVASNQYGLTKLPY